MLNLRLFHQQHYLILIIISIIRLPNDITGQRVISHNFRCSPTGCCDHHEFCRFWSSMGECTLNIKWMGVNCQLACNMCPPPMTQLADTLSENSQLPTNVQTQQQQMPLRNVRNQRPLSNIPPPPLQPPPPSSSQPTQFRTTEIEVHRPAPSPQLQQQPIRFVNPPPIARPPPPRQQPQPQRQPLQQPQQLQQPLQQLQQPLQQPMQQQQLQQLPPLQQCDQLKIDSSASIAELMIQRQLIFTNEDVGNRRTPPLSVDDITRSNQASACVPRLDVADCRSTCYHLYFRSMDGTCNNLANPLFGAAFRPYSRLVMPEYDDGLGEPVSSLRPTRPSAREITRLVLSSPKTIVDNELNALLMQFGQFISHDIAKTTLIQSSRCTTCQPVPGICMIVPISQFDTNNNFRSTGCIRIPRSAPICGSGRQFPRQQLNENTNFIDGSAIYGSSIVDLAKVRDGASGFLSMANFNNQRVLPFDQSKCPSHAQCTVTFTAGDSRVNLFLGLSSMHILLTREHNRIASILQSMNRHWNGDRLFQETRKIVGAIIHAITYREYLPKILGQRTFNLTIGVYTGYDVKVDATLANEFTSAAYRFGHGMLQEFYPLINEFNTSIGGFPFSDGVFKSSKLIFEGGIDPILRGLMMTPLKRPQRITPSLTEQMFGNTDLGTINVQRGRDHGVPSYNRFREFCGLPRANTFDQLRTQIANVNALTTLQQIYANPDQIDLYVGAMVEDPVDGGMIGPTLACIIGPQFKRLRDGDRFYYENPGIFTNDQLVELRKASMARLLCDNGDRIGAVPMDAFRLSTIAGSSLQSCNTIPIVDLRKWNR